MDGDGVTLRITITLTHTIPTSQIGLDPLRRLGARARTATRRPGD